MDDFPSNSRTFTAGGSKITPAGAPKPAPEPDAVKLEPVVTGKVVHRKKSLRRRFREMFFNGDSNNVVSYIAKEVLIPALQNLATDMVTQGIEKAVYGEVRSPSRTVRGSSVSGRSHISYDRVSSAHRPSTIVPRRANIQPSSLDIGDIIVEDQFTAEQIINSLYETVQKYKTATVANLRELLHETPHFMDSNYGWTNLDEMGAQRVREGYLLILPEPEDIR